MKRRGSQKRGAGRFVQLPESLQASEAWGNLRPGPRALYVELKRRYKGHNNGRIVLSHRDAADALNVHRNTVGAWFWVLQEHGLIRMVDAPYLGAEGIGKSATWALTELHTVDGRGATHDYLKWRANPKPRPKNCA